MWRRPDNGRNTIDAYTTKERNTAFPLPVILCVTGRNLLSVVQVGQVENGVNIGPVLHRLAQNDSWCNNPAFFTRNFRH